MGIPQFRFLTRLLSSAEAVASILARQRKGVLATPPATVHHMPNQSPIEWIP